jgi:hypothetical protein
VGLGRADFVPGCAGESWERYDLGEGEFEEGVGVKEAEGYWDLTGEKEDKEVGKSLQHWMLLLFEGWECLGGLLAARMRFVLIRVPEGLNREAGVAKFSGFVPLVWESIFVVEGLLRVRSMKRISTSVESLAALMMCEIEPADFVVFFLLKTMSVKEEGGVEDLLICFVLPCTVVLLEG